MPKEKHNKTEINLGDATEWLLKQGFKLYVKIEDSGQGYIQKIGLYKSGEHITDVLYNDIESAARDYIKNQIRNYKNKINFCENQLKFYKTYSDMFPPTR